MPSSARSSSTRAAVLVTMPTRLAMSLVRCGSVRVRQQAPHQRDADGGRAVDRDAGQHLPADVVVDAEAASAPYTRRIALTSRAGPSGCGMTSSSLV